MAAGEDSEGEWEEEEQLVVVHLSGVIDTEYLKKCDSNNCKVLVEEEERDKEKSVKEDEKSKAKDNRLIALETARETAKRKAEDQTSTSRDSFKTRKSSTAEYLKEKTVLEIQYKNLELEHKAKELQVRKQGIKLRNKELEAQKEQTQTMFNTLLALGVETDEPVLQIDQMCFCGTYDDSIGTNIIFEEKGEVISGKEEKHLEYMCHTTKNLDMIRIFLKEDHDDDNEEGKESQKPANRNDDDEQEDKVQENAAPHENNENMADNSKESEMQSANLTQPSERTENEDLTDQMDAT